MPVGLFGTQAATLTARLFSLALAVAGAGCVRVSLSALFAVFLPST